MKIMRKLVLIFIVSFATVTAKAQPMKALLSKFVTAPGGGEYINVNLYDSAAGNIGKYSTAGWNDWNINLQNSTTCVANSAYLNKSDGSPSTVRIKWVSNTGTCIVAGYNDNQSGESTYGDSETFPNFVKAHMRSNPYTTSIDTRLITGGLTDGEYYTYYILVTRNTTQNRRVTFTHLEGEATQTVNAWDNLTTEVVLSMMTPTGGVITLDVDILDGYAFIGAITIKKEVL